MVVAVTDGADASLLQVEGSQGWDAQAHQGDSDLCAGPDEIRGKVYWPNVSSRSG